MKIGIDIDDTISDTYEVLFNYSQEYTANILKREPIINDINDCTTHSYIEKVFGWTEEETEKFWDLYFEEIIQKVKPKTFAKEYLKKLQEENNEIVLITARHKIENNDLNVEQETSKWLKENNIPYNKLIVNARDKKKIAEEEKIDIFIDDSFFNCQAVSETGAKTYIMDARVNSALKDEKIERVYSWTHFYMKFKNLEVKGE